MTNDPYQLWFDMPDFKQEKILPYAKIIIRVESEEHLKELSERLEQPLTKKTKSVWFPAKSHWGQDPKIWLSDES